MIDVPNLIAGVEPLILSAELKRMHLDVMAAEPAAEVDGTMSLRVALSRFGDGYTLFGDPEGSSFCIVES